MKLNGFRVNFSASWFTELRRFLSGKTKRHIGVKNNNDWIMVRKCVTVLKGKPHSFLSS